MRTTLNIDEKLLEKVMTFSGEKTRNKAVSKALEEYVRQRAVEDLIKMAGTIDFEEDWRKLRAGHTCENQ